jgi:hypothetical protein
MHSSTSLAPHQLAGIEDRDDEWNYPDTLRELGNHRERGRVRRPAVGVALSEQRDQGRDETPGHEHNECWTDDYLLRLEFRTHPQ